MNLVKVKLTNYRGYRNGVAVPVDDLTALVGKNDAGKSTLLDALNVVLGDGKIDASDICVYALNGESLSIECSFDSLPQVLTLDSGSSTALADEYLVDAQGLLRLRWTWQIKRENDELSLGKQEIHAVALHPTGEGVSDLHQKKNSELKIQVRQAGVDGDCDLTNNASMRAALWRRAEAEEVLYLAETAINLAKEDGKAILKQIEQRLPMYVLFRADRPSTDQDAEVQDPMRVAVREALDALQDDIQRIKDAVRDQSIAVARRTLDKLKEFDPLLASSLTPTFAEPKLEGAFKLSLLGDDGIPINKRGSGVRRLVLFSFFRAEAERRQVVASNRGIIYAIEEPETAQHPDFQRMVVDSLITLSEHDATQVLLTTHVPGLASLLPIDSLRLVEAGDRETGVAVGCGTDDVYQRITETLGVIPDKRTCVLLCVEGPNDLACLRAMCRCYRSRYPELVCIEKDVRIALVLLGGGSLLNWTADHLLRNTGLREFHIYDRDLPGADGTYKYNAAVEMVIGRSNGDTARLTNRREIENYLHPAAIDRVLSPVVGHAVQVRYGHQDDVEAVVAEAIRDHNGNPQTKVKRRQLKSWLNHEVASAMTIDELMEMDEGAEVLGWFQGLTEMVG